MTVSDKKIQVIIDVFTNSGYSAWIIWIVIPGIKGRIEFGQDYKSFQGVKNMAKKLAKIFNGEVVIQRRH